VISKPSLSSKTPGRKLQRMSWLLLFAASAICGAQQVVPSNLSRGLEAPPAQKKPVQIIHHKEDHPSHWRGTPWIATSSGATGLPTATAADHASFSGQPSRNGVATGLQVSGWWTIDVKNSDGSAAEHREFENDYLPTVLVPYLLGGKVVPGEAAIQFGAGSAGAGVGNPANFTVSPCAGTGGCLISQVAGGVWNNLPQCSQSPGSCATGMTTSGTTASVQEYEDSPKYTVPALELSGSITAQTNSSLEYLQSMWTFCSENPATDTSPLTAINPVQCAAGTAMSGTLSDVLLTWFALDNPLPISAGQVIQIKVDLAFSPVGFD
jgi:hypothetical protein